LSSIIESGIISTDNNFIRLEISEADRFPKPVTLKESLDSHEKSLINAAMVSCDGNITNAAKTLGIPRTTLNAKMRKSAAKITS
jgi:transcriptional regulator of acetoin/glycerol metabolism